MTLPRLARRGCKRVLETSVGLLRAHPEIKFFLVRPLEFFPGLYDRIRDIVWRISPPPNIRKRPELTLPASGEPLPKETLGLSPSALQIFIYLRQRTRGNRF